MGCMDHQHKEHMINTTNVNAEPLGELLHVYEALRAGDEARLRRLWETTPSTEEFSEILRVAVAHDSYPIVSRGVVRAHEHGALWMMPVVVDPVHGDELVVDMWMQRWLQAQVSGQRQKATTIDKIPSMESILALQPTHLQGLLTMLLGHDTSAPTFGFNASSAGELQRHLPRLRFIVGAISRIDENPEFPSMDTLELQTFARHASLQASVQGRGDVLIQDTVRVGEMLPFRDAVVAGLLLWIEEISRRYEVMAWSLEPRMSVVHLGIELILEECNHAVLGVPLPLWEVGREGIAAVTDRCSVWKFCPDLLTSVPVSAKLS